MSLEKQKKKISNHTFLVTGGAGFIGSNIVKYLLDNEAKHVKVLDNLSNSSIENIEKFFSYKNFEFIEGDIRSIDTCIKASRNINFISHQAALGSVPRSIKYPIETNDVNIGGHLNMLISAKDSKSLIKMVYASSSSCYGYKPFLPNEEGKEGKPLSPYAITKLTNENYSEIFSKVYNLNTVGLRYFNVYGPNQSLENPYAAVIPLFIKAALSNNRPFIYGDGKTSRDFTYVDNVVQANIISMFNTKNIKNHQIFNIACGNSCSLNQLWEMISNITNSKLKPIYKEERQGDIKHSYANINKAKKLIFYKPITDIQSCLMKTINFEKNTSSSTS
tara:strand:- start:2654 stop:3652 length:999 start_codon:yes stop_codon:yes gene_type:complete